MKVFISYGTNDATDLALRLEGDLRSAGHEPWLDRFRLKGGANWTSTIEEAIDDCGAMLALLTPASYRSPICRAEQLRALRKCKPVIPLLAQENADRPLHLEHFDFRDFTGKYEEAYQVLSQDLGNLVDSGAVTIPEAFHRTYLKVPPRPPHVVDRPEEVKRLRDVLLSEEAGDAVAVTALRGLGGIGKTVLANLLARDPVVQDAFPDGILWFNIGRTPTSLARQLMEVGREVEGQAFKPENYSTLEAATSRLQTVLPSKAALLILDDVWDSEHIQPFFFEASRCRILFTTREARIASKLGAAEVRLGTLPPEQSLEMLRGWAVRDDPALGDIAESLGHLPLALRIAGARLREGMTAKRWLEDFAGRVGRMRLSRHSKTCDENVEACFLQSLDAFKDEVHLFDVLGIFPEDVPVPAMQVQRLWRAVMPGLTDFDCREILHDFDRASLLQVTPENMVTLHDLVYEFARERLGKDAPRYNERFLATYSQAGRPWNEIPDDGYLYSHLAWHLKEAGRAQELEHLLGNYLWLEAKLKRCSVPELLSDFDLLEPKHGLRTVQKALLLSANVLSARPQELPSQLVARLAEPDCECARELCRYALGVRKTSWLRPLRAPLAKAGGALLYTFLGHRTWVTAVAVTPDGKRAISAADTLKVWDLDNGAELLSLEGLRCTVNALAVAPDGKRAISSSVDHTLQGWNLESGAKLGSLNRRSNTATAVTVPPDEKPMAVTPDGRRAISASDDHTIKLWDLESGAELRSLEDPSSRVTAIAVAPDGRHAISGFHDGTLKLWELESGTELRSLQGHGDAVNAVAVTPDGKRAVSASKDHTLRVWDLESGAELRSLQGHSDTANAVAVTPDGKRAISGSHDRTLKVWDLESGAELRSLEDHSDWVTAVAVTPDGKRAISASADRTVKVWDLESGAELRGVEGHTRSVNAVVAAPDMKRAVSASADHTLKVWDLESGAELRSLKGHSGAVNAVAVTPDGKRAVSASMDRTLKVWDLESGAELRSLKGHSDWVTALAVTPDGKRAVSASADHTLKVWDLESGAELRSLEDHGDWVMAVATELERESLSSSWVHESLKEWVEQDRMNGTGLRWLPRGYFARALAERLNSECKFYSLSWDDAMCPMAVTPDGKRVISASMDHTLKVWNLESGAVLCTLEGHRIHWYNWFKASTRAVWYWSYARDLFAFYLENKVCAVAVTPDGKRAVSASRDRTLMVWDLESGARMLALGHRGRVTAVAVTPDGKRAVSASTDLALKVWDLESGAELRSLKGHSNSVTAVAATLDGKRAVSASMDHTLKVWDLESGAELGSFTAEAPITCVCLTRNHVLAGDQKGGFHLLAVQEAAAGAPQ
jgi:WD40 repeat protein